MFCTNCRRNGDADLAEKLEQEEDVREDVREESPVPEPQQQQNVTKVKATGGVKLMIINQAPPTKKEEEIQASAHRSYWTLVHKVNVCIWYSSPFFLHACSRTSGVLNMHIAKATD